MNDVPAEIRNYRSTTRRPADFDAFWDQARAELARVPISASFERSAMRSTNDVDTYEVTFSSLTGVSIFGWLSIGTGGGKRPGLVIYPGYSGSPGVPRFWAREGYAVLQMSPRGHHKSDAQFGPGFPGLMTAGIDNPSRYAYRGVYCDTWRAVDVLLTRPEVDPSRIGVTGGSQGGALSLIAAAGHPQVRVVASDVPFLTSIRDALRLGNSYPYEEVKDYLRLQPGHDDEVLNTLDYVDTINFADRITAPTLLSVGLKDDICPPHTAFALLDRLTCEKQIEIYPEAGHEGGGFAHGAVKQQWLARHLLS